MSAPTTSGSTPTDGEVCGLVNELSRAIARHVRQVAERFGLTEAQAVALRELSEPCTLSELARRMCCEAPNATYVADRLEHMALLARRPHPTDRRAKLLHLTAEGAARREAMMVDLRARSPLQRLSADDQIHLRDLLIQAAGDVPTTRRSAAPSRAPGSSPTR